MRILFWEGIGCIPISTDLSFQAVAMTVMERALDARKTDSLCPEVKKATLTDSGWQSIEDHCRSTDSYVSAMCEVPES